MKALILAAGYSTRLYPLTLNRSKALLPIGDRPMLDYLVSEICTLPELQEIVLVTNDRFYRDFLSWAEGAEKRYAPARFTVLNDGTHSDAEKLGAVGDIRFAIEKAGIDDDLLIAASDNFFTFPLIDFYRDFRAHGCDTLLGAHIAAFEDLKRFAVATLDENRRVVGLVEKPQNPPSDIAIYALYLYRRDTLPMIAQYLNEGGAPDAPGHFPEWLYRRKDLRCFLFEGECIDIGTKEAYHDICARYA